jgi:hypothetical protein
MRRSLRVCSGDVEEAVYARLHLQEADVDQLDASRLIHRVVYDVARNGTAASREAKVITATLVSASRSSLQVPLTKPGR